MDWSHRNYLSFVFVSQLFRIMNQLFKPICTRSIAVVFARLAHFMHNQTVYNNYMECKYPFALDSNNNLVDILSAQQGDELFCPFCGKRMIPRLKGEYRMKHFAHKESCTETWTYDMSEWHRMWQSFFPGKTEEFMEYNGKKHKADVFANNKVIEFQHSPMTLEEFRDRNDFYSSFGYDVIWVFDLTELVEKGNIEKIRDANMEYKWLYTLALFKGMDLPNEKATIFFQLNKLTDMNDPILLRVYKEAENFKYFYADSKVAMSANEFIKYINGSYNDMVSQIFDESKNSSESNKYPFVVENDRYNTKRFKYPKTIEELWDFRYEYMIVNRVRSNKYYKIYGNDFSRGIRASRGSDGRVRGGSYWEDISGSHISVWSLEECGFKNPSQINKATEKEAYEDTVSNADRILEWKRYKDFSNQKTDKEQTLADLVDMNYPHSFVARSKFGESYLFFLFKKTFHYTYERDCYFRYYNAYYYDPEINEYLDGLEANCFIRNHLLEQKWERLIPDKISNDHERIPSIVKYHVEKPAEFIGSYTLNELRDMNRGENFVAKCKSKSLVCLFIASGYFAHNAYEYDIETEEYEENGKSLNHIVWGDYEKLKWQLYQHKYPGMELNYKIRNKQNEVFRNLGKNTNEKGEDFYTVFELASKTDGDVILAKCTLTNYLYRITFSSNRGFGKRIMKVEIFNEETGEELTGSLDGFDYRMVNLSIWKQYTDDNKQ